jgi:hypothetical protein
LERKIYVVDTLHDVFAERFAAWVAAMYAGASRQTWAEPSGRLANAR